MSTLNEEGVMDVKRVCCDKPLAARVEQKLASRRREVLNRLCGAAWPATQPIGGDSALGGAQPREEGVRRAQDVTEKELQEENGGAGVYSADLRKNYMLDDDDWKYDIVPEIYNCKNAAISSIRTSTSASPNWSGRRTSGGEVGDGEGGARHGGGRGWTTTRRLCSRGSRAAASSSTRIAKKSAGNNV